MRILLVAPQPFYTLRGTPIAVRLVVQTLCEAGHEVHLLVYHAGEDIAIPGMKLFRARRPPGVGRVPIGISAQKLACDVYLIASMIRLIRRHRYDVIHAVEEAIFPAAVMKAFMPKPKLIYDMDSSLSDQLTDKWRLLKPFRRLFEVLERRAVLRSAATLAVCEALAAKVRPWAGADRVTVLPDIALNGTCSGEAVESLREIVASLQSTLGLYVGNLEKYQGIELLFEAMLALDPKVPFHMVLIGGEPGDVRSWRERAKLRGLADRMHFLGKRPVEDLGFYLEQADVLVSPRILGNNTPMKISSYLQAGKPILATDIYSHTQMLNADCALLVRPTPEDFAAGLRRLAEDPTLRATLGKAARAKAELECSPQAFRTRLLAAYDRVLMAAVSWLYIGTDAVLGWLAP